MVSPRSSSLDGTKGGQGCGDPSQDTDPGLGTWEELRDAVAYANKKGVKIILSGKYIAPISLRISTKKSSTNMPQPIHTVSSIKRADTVT